MKFTILLDPPWSYLLYILSLSVLKPGSREEDFIKNNAFSLYDLYAHSPSQEPLPRRSWKFHFRRPFLGHHYYSLSLTDLSLGVEKKIFKVTMHFHYITFMATPYRKNPCAWDHESYNFCRPFLVHHYYILSLLNLCPWVEKKIFQEFCIFTIWLIWPHPIARTPASWVMKVLFK